MKKAFPVMSNLRTNCIEQYHELNVCSCSARALITIYLEQQIYFIEYVLITLRGDKDEKFLSEICIFKCLKKSAIMFWP